MYSKQRPKLRKFKLNPKYVHKRSEGLRRIRKHASSRLVR